MVVGADAGTHVLVAKSRDDIEKIWPAALGALGRGALSLLGRGGAKAAAGKGAQVGVKGAAGTAGATGAGAITPAAGATTTALQPASATAGTSMASSSSAQGAAQAAPVKVQPSQPAQGGNIFDDAVRETQMGDLSPADATSPNKGTLEDFGMKLEKPNSSPKNMATAQKTPPPTETHQSTLKPDDPTLQAAEAETQANRPSTAKDLADSEAKKRKTDQLQYAIMAQQMFSGHRGQKSAQQQAEMERIERLAQDGKANSTTGGGKVAVA